MIIDESDERMFRDLTEFNAKTKSEKVHTICLTATPYDGEDGGLEKRVLDELGYKIYYNSIKQEDFTPTVHKSYEIGTYDEQRRLI